MQSPIAHYYCLDEEFDAPDIEADYDLCQAIAAGRMGLHPDAWSNHDPLPLRWLLRKRREEPEAEELPRDPQWKESTKWAKHRRPVEELPPKPRWVIPLAWVPVPEPVDIFDGEIQLDCDDCGGKFGFTLVYRAGYRAAVAAQLREQGRDKGWTHIVGRDRCPKCSCIPVPEPVGNGAGQHDRHE